MVRGVHPYDPRSIFPTMRRIGRSARMAAVSNPTSFRQPAVHRLSATDGFVVIDGTAETACGIVRVARKILRDGAVNLARFETYAAAALGLPWCGASVGVNAEGDSVEAAMTAALDELADVTPTLRLDAAKGVPPSAADQLRASDPRPPIAETALAEATVLIVRRMLDAVGHGHAPIVVSDGVPQAQHLTAALTAAGHEVIAPDTAGDTSAVLLVGARPGEIDHTRAEHLSAAAVLGVGPLAVTPRALAVLERRGTTVLPDFVLHGAIRSLRAEEAAVRLDVDKAAERAGDIVERCAGGSEGIWSAACDLAEHELAQRGPQPFGRPLP